MWREILKGVGRSAWFFLRIHWRHARYHYEMAQQPPTFPVSERRYPIPPSQLHRYATAADEMFYRPVGQQVMPSALAYPALQAASAVGVPVS